MDRLVKIDEQDLPIPFKPNQRSSTTVRLTNLMHTMSVAVSLTTTTTSPSLFTITPSYTVLLPLSSSLFTLSLTHPSSSPPLSSPPHSLLVRTCMLPTGKANQDELRRIFSRPGPHIFKDGTIPISLVGESVIDFLLSTPSMSINNLDLPFLISKAMSTCSPVQLTSLLTTAVRSGNLGFVSALIDAGADVSVRDSNGLSLMYNAVHSNNLDVVRVLIESGCRIVDEVDLFLHDAAEMNRIDLMKILLGNSVNSPVKKSVNLVDQKGNLVDSPRRRSGNLIGKKGNSVDSPVRKSNNLIDQKGNSVDLVPVRNSGNLVNSVDSAGRTAVHVSAFHGRIEALKLCVSMGGDADGVDVDGWTPLHCAAAQGHIECVEYLVDCSVYTKYSINKDGKTPFLLALDNGHSDTLEMLQLGDVLSRAARVDDVNLIKNCIEEGADVNGRDQNGWTPLHRAAFKGRLECVKLLLSHGAKTDVVDDVGYSPLHCAIEAGNVEVAVCLIAHGALAGLKSLKGVCCLNLDGFKNHPAFVSPMHNDKELA